MDTYLEILIDNSSSMGYWEHGNEKKSYLLPDGSTRMELAKKVLLEDIIPNLDYAKAITVRIFHSLTNPDKSTKPIISSIFSGDLKKEELAIKITELKIPHNTGGTPITAAIKQSIDELATHPNADKKIILVTDGEETDGGDYKKAAEEALMQHGIPCNIFIVGIAQNKEAEEKSKNLATSTGGSYINLKEKVYDKPTLQTALRPIYFKAINASLQNITAKKPGFISQPTPVDKVNTQNVQTGEAKAETTYSEALQKNSVAFDLISKQLSTIAAAIDGLNRFPKEEDTDIEITENAELNERVRIASESFLYNKLKEKFGSRITWLNEIKESGSIYDFEVTDTLDKSIEYFIECKASMYDEKVFLMTKSEWLFFLQNKSNYQVYFVASALSNPTVTKIENLMEWIVKGKVVPFSTKNMKLKAERIVFSILE